MYNEHTVLRIPHDLNYNKHFTKLGQRYCFLEELDLFGFREITLSPIEVLSVAFEFRVLFFTLRKS